MTQILKEYLQKSYPLFPIKAGTKSPLTKNGFRDSSTDPDQIEEWITKFPNCNWAIATGHQFDVIDLDGPEGVASFRRWAAEVDWDWKPGYRVKTPHGNHIYVHPTGLGNAVKFLPGIDYRGIGGYVLAPPSAIWDPQQGRRIPYRIGNSGPVLDGPAVLRSLIRKPKLRPTLSCPAAPLVGADCTPYGRAAIARGMQQIASAVSGATQGRNHTLFVVGRALYELAAGGELREGFVDEALELAAGLMAHPLDDEEMTRTIGQAKKAGLANPRRRAS